MSTIEDDREALAKVVYYWDVSENVGSKTWGRLLDGQREVWREAADAILTAGFRRYNPITDAQVEAARFAYAGERVNQSLRVGTEPNTVAGRAEKSRAAMRAALEAARGSS